MLWQSLWCLYYTDLTHYWVQCPPGVSRQVPHHPHHSIVAWCSRRIDWWSSPTLCHSVPHRYCQTGSHGPRHSQTYRQTDPQNQTGRHLKVIGTLIGHMDKSLTRSVQGMLYIMGLQGVHVFLFRTQRTRDTERAGYWPFLDMDLSDSLPNVWQIELFNVSKYHWNTKQSLQFQSI